MERTKNNDAFHINLCLNYGGREDIVQAVNKLIKDNAYWIAHGTLGDNADVEYSVLENKDNRLVLSLTVSTEDSETGAEATKVYTNTYNLVTGELID